MNISAPPTKPNDWFVVNQLNPSATPSDLAGMAIDTENTGFNSKSYYEDQPAVKKLFKNKQTGEFDQAAFDTYYDGLVTSYNDFAANPYQITDFTQNVLYSPHNLLVPLESRRFENKVTIGQIFNSEQQKVGIMSPELWSQSEFSIREIAQTQDVKNVKGESLNFTPNDDNKRGLFDFYYDRFFGSKDVLVLAQWDEDGEHEDLFTGEIISHKKGEHKLNEYGKYYYETLEGRSPVNKIILSPWDTVTVEGTRINKLDFMDSDSKEKSLIGSLMKTAVTIAPYFIPGFGKAYALFTAGVTAVEFLPQIGNMVGKFIEGEDFKSRDLYKSFNYWSGVGASFINPTVSDNSMQKIWTMENLLAIVPEIFIQLKQQKALAELPRMLKIGNADAKALSYIANNTSPEKFKKVKQLWKQADKVKDYSERAMAKQMALLAGESPEVIDLYRKWVNFENKVSKGLAIGYMTAASSKDVDGVIEEFDIQGRDAAWMKLGVLSGFWFMMSKWSLGDWQVDYALGIDDAAKLLRISTKAQGQLYKNQLLTASAKSDIAGEVVEEGLTGWQKFKSLSGTQFFKEGFSLGKSIFEKIDLSPIGRGMLKESIEEMSEETITDSAKHIYNIFSTLNLTTNKNQRIDWENDDILSRYAMAGIGGALGGAMFHFNDALLSPIRREQYKQDWNRNIVELVRNKQSQQVYDAIEKIRNSKEGFASKNLTFSVYNKIQDTSGEKIIFEPATGQALSQNDVIANMIKLQVQTIEKAIFDGKIPSDKDMQEVFNQRTATLLDFESGQLNISILDDLTKLTSEYVELFDTYETMQKDVNQSDLEQKRLQKLLIELQDKQKQIQELSSPESIGKYYAEALFNMDRILSGNFAKFQDEEDIAKSLYNKNYNDLEDYQKKVVDREVKTEVSRETLKLKKLLFDRQQKLFNNDVQGIAEFLQPRADALHVFNAINFEYDGSDEALEKVSSHLLPAYGKKGLPEFLTLNKGVKLDGIENFKTEINKFMFVVSEILDKFQVSPESISNEEWLLLEIVHKKFTNTPLALLSQSNVLQYDVLSKIFRDNGVTAEEMQRTYLNVASVFNFGGYKAYSTLETNMPLQYAVDVLSEKITEEFTDSDGQTYEIPILDDSSDAGKSIFIELVNNLSQILELDPTLSPEIKQQQEIGLMEFALAKKFGEIWIDNPAQKNPVYSQLDKLIGKLDIQYKSNTRSILDLLEQERNRMLERPIEDYINTSEITNKELEKQIEQLDRLFQIVHAYTNFSQDPATQIGYFPALNQYNKQNGVAEEYAQIPSELGVFIAMEIQRFRLKLEYLKKLSDYNLNSKIPNKEKAELNMNIIQFRNFIMSIKELEFTGEGSSAKSLIQFLKEKRPDMDLISEFFLNDDESTLRESINNLSVSAVESKLKLIWDVESLLQEEFQKKSSENQIKFIEKQIESSIDLKKLKTELITEKPTIYDKHSSTTIELDRLIYLGLQFTSNTKQFVLDYNNLLQNQEFKFGLFGDQQQAVKTLYAFAYNIFNSKFDNSSKERFSFDDFLNLFKKRVNEFTTAQTEEQDKQIILESSNVYLNKIYNMFGVQGTGKTEAVLDVFSRMLKLHGINTVGVAKEENISNKLMATMPVNMIADPKKQNLNSIISLIFGEKNYQDLMLELSSEITGATSLVKMSNIVNGDKNQTILSIDKDHELYIRLLKHAEETSVFGLKLGKDFINLIQIDEGTQIPFVLDQLLNDFVTKYNEKAKEKLMIVKTGDWRQIGFTMRGKTSDGLETVAAHGQQFFHLKTIDLNSSIRSENNVKDFNQRQLSTLAEHYQSKWVFEAIDNKLKYHMKGDVLYGEKPVNYSVTSEEQIIEQILSQGNQKSDIVIIADDNNLTLKGLANRLGVDFVGLSNVNGVEYKFAVVNISPQGYNKQPSNYFRVLNTVLTRSKQASYINEDFILNEQRIQFVAEKELFDTKIPQSKIDAYRQKRVGMIQNIQNALYNVPLPTETKTKEIPKQNRNTAQVFNQTESGVEQIAPTTEDISKLFEENLNHSDVFSKDSEFAITYSQHGFNAAETTDPSGRHLFDMKSRRDNLNAIKTFAKKQLIKHLYENVKISDASDKLRDFIKDRLSSNIKDVNLVLYLRDYSKTFDKSITGKTYDKILVYAIRLELNDGTYSYIPIAAQSEKLMVALDEQEIDLTEDVVLDRSKAVKFLSPNMSVTFDVEEKQVITNGQITTIKDKSQYVPARTLELEGYVVSPIYILNKDIKEGGKSMRGREFVLISTDKSKTPDMLYDAFVEELRQGSRNKKIKNAMTKTQIADLQLDAYQLSDSTVKLVFLERNSYPFYDGTGNDWLSIIDRGRRQDFALVRSFGDSYVMSRIFDILNEKFKTLTKDQRDTSGTISMQKLEDADKPFILFYQDLISALRVLSAYSSENNILKVIGDANGVNDILNKITKNLEDQDKAKNDPFFKSNHVFLYLFNMVLDGGSFKIPNTDKTFKFSTVDNTAAHKENLKQYINDVIRDSGKFTDKSQNKYGIWYTAQTTKSKGEKSESDFQFLQNGDLDYFTVPKIKPQEIYLPISQLFKDQEEVEEVEETKAPAGEPETKDLNKEVYFNTLNLNKLFLSPELTKELEDLQTKIWNATDADIDSKINQFLSEVNTLVGIVGEYELSIDPDLGTLVLNEASKLSEQIMVVKKIVDELLFNPQIDEEDKEILRTTSAAFFDNPNSETKETLIAASLSDYNIQQHINNYEDLEKLLDDCIDPNNGSVL